MNTPRHLRIITIEFPRHLHSVETLSITNSPGGCGIIVMYYLVAKLNRGSIPNSVLFKIRTLKNKVPRNGLRR